MTSLNAELDKMQKPSKVPFLRTEIPGPKSLAILAAQEELETKTVIYPKSFPIAVKRGFNSVIEDADGNFLIDWVSGISVLNLGHSDIVRNAVSSQMSEIWHTLEIPSETRTEFLRQVKKSFPNDMQDYKIMFGTTGAEACETSINIAHVVSGRGARASTIVFEGAYHGVAGGIISATAGSHYRNTVYSRGLNVVRVPYPYKMWYNYDTNDVLESLEKIQNDPSAGYDLPDSLIVEPILGEGGYIVPPQGFLKALREFCDEHDILMIVDEIQSGVGRTGKMWAFEWESIKPDIVCVSKSIGGGIPISLIYYRDDVDAKLPTPFHLGTFRANSLAMAAGTAILREVPKHLNYVLSEGPKFMQRISSIRSPSIAEVRGKGFMIGIELVNGTKPMDSKSMMQMKHEMLKRGLMMHTCGHFGNVFRFMGSLNIPHEYLETGAKIFEEALRSVNSKST
jgi:4-aminobutyrate aminotransferase-like enzyme